MCDAFNIKRKIPKEGDFGGGSKWVSKGGATCKCVGGGCGEAGPGDACKLPAM